MVLINALSVDDLVVIDNSLFKVTDVQPMSKDGLIAWTAVGIFDQSWITYVEYSDNRVELADIATKSLPVTTFHDEDRECVVRDKTRLKSAYVPIGQMDPEMKSLHRYGALVWFMRLVESAFSFAAIAKTIYFVISFCYGVLSMFCYSFILITFYREPAEYSTSYYRTFAVSAVMFWKRYLKFFILAVIFCPFVTTYNGLFSKIYYSNLINVTSYDQMALSTDLPDWVRYNQIIVLVSVMFATSAIGAIFNTITVLKIKKFSEIAGPSKKSRSEVKLFIHSVITFGVDTFGLLLMLGTLFTPPASWFCIICVELIPFASDAITFTSGFVLLACSIPLKKAFRKQLGMNASVTTEIAINRIILPQMTRTTGFTHTHDQ